MTDERQKQLLDIFTLALLLGFAYMMRAATEATVLPGMIVQGAMMYFFQSRQQAATQAVVKEMSRADGADPAKAA